MDLTLIEKLQS